MDDEAPPSLETRALLAQLHQKRSYPFLRMLRSVLRVCAALYVAGGVLLAVALIAEGLPQDTMDLVEQWGGAAKGQGLFAAFLLLLGVAVRVAFVLAMSEGIQLLLDLRAAQVEAAATAQLQSGATRPSEPVRT